MMKTSRSKNISGYKNNFISLRKLSSSEDCCSSVFSRVKNSYGNFLRKSRNCTAVLIFTHGILAEDYSAVSTFTVRRGESCLRLSENKETREFKYFSTIIEAKVGYRSMILI